MNSYFIVICFNVVKHGIDQLRSCFVAKQLIGLNKNKLFKENKPLPHTATINGEETLDVALTKISEFLLTLDDQSLQAFNFDTSNLSIIKASKTYTPKYVHQLYDNLKIQKPAILMEEVNKEKFNDDEWDALLIHIKSNVIELKPIVKKFHNVLVPYADLITKLENSSVNASENPASVDDSQDTGVNDLKKMPTVFNELVEHIIMIYAQTIPLLTKRKEK